MVVWFARTDEPMIHAILNQICMSFQFTEENDVKAGEEKSNTTVQIEEDGPSETFKDEESKVECPGLEISFLLLFIIYHLNCRTSLLTRFHFII